MISTNRTVSFTAAGAILALWPLGYALASDGITGAQRNAPETPPGLLVAIALDPALTSPLHLGKRYVATEKFQTARQRGRTLTIEVDAGVSDAQWTPGDRSAVRVFPTRGAKVTFLVSQCDTQTGVNVVSSSGSATLSITTTCDEDTIRADISQ